MRTGAYALSLLAEPLHIQILKALEMESLSSHELSSELDSVPESTLRRYLRNLSEVRVLERRRNGDCPASRDYALTGTGRDLLFVADVLQAWLSIAPDGPVSLGTAAAKMAVKALDDAWSPAIVRALAARPFTLVELDSLITELTYPQLERRLALLRRTGQIGPCLDGRPGQGRIPYTATAWLRRAIAPLIIAIRWERLHLPAETPMLTRIDAEAALLLTIPMLTLPAGISGRCRLVVEVEHRANTRMAGVIVEVREGRVVSCISRLAGDTVASATGSGQAWLGAVIERRPGELRVDGRSELATGMINGLHDFLFSEVPQS